MNKRVITNKSIKSFEKFLIENEKAIATIQKYLHDIRRFAEYVSKQALNKTIILNYKSELEKNYTVRSANSKIAALNVFLRFSNWQDLCIKQLKAQTETYCSKEKELTKAEYI